MFKWSKEAQQSFETLKNALAHKQILKTLAGYESRPIVLMSDSSKWQISGVLCVLILEDDRLFPIAYAVKALSSADEKKKPLCYCVTKVFQYYLIGRRFNVLVDNSCIAKMLQTDVQLLDETLTWIRMKLSIFEFKCVHIRGSFNVSDMLSRIPQRTLLVWLPGHKRVRQKHKKA